MRMLLLFSKMVFICNTCFLLLVVVHYIPSINKELLPQVIVIMGTVLAITLNAILNIAVVSIAIVKRTLQIGIPVYILATNFIFFVLQVILLIK